MTTSKGITVAVAACGLLFLTFPRLDAGTGTQSAELAVEWNRVVLEVAEAEDGFLTLKGLRTITMMHLAMHDALTAISGEYASYAFEASAPEADRVVAATQAAYAIATGQYPDQATIFEATRDSMLRRIPRNRTFAESLKLGDEAAMAILKARSRDHWDAEAEYQWHPMGPGVYAEFNEHSGTPQGFVFGAGWGAASPFSLDRIDEFRVPPPPATTDSAYTRAFNEVKDVGRFQSQSRTMDQTHLALWWKDFAESAQNRLARDLVTKEDLSLVAANRLFALVNMGIFDAYVSSFENKFFYNHWRPYTAIRWAANDNNPDTVPEENWTNLHRHTYAFPSYPSAHGTACGAAMAAFADTFGDSYPFTMRIPLVDIAGPFSGKMEMRPSTRSFEHFSDAATECGLSRLYLGIHFRYDSVAGVELGTRIGRHTVQNRLKPTRRR
jgi:hypothetical protein